MRLIIVIILTAHVCFSLPLGEQGDPIPSEVVDPSATRFTDEKQEASSNLQENTVLPNPVEILAVWGCLGSTTPRHSTYGCVMDGNDVLTIQGRNFPVRTSRDDAPQFMTIELIRSKSVQFKKNGDEDTTGGSAVEVSSKLLCRDVRSSESIPSMLLYCKLGALKSVDGTVLPDSFSAADGNALTYDLHFYAKTLRRGSIAGVLRKAVTFRTNTPNGRIENEDLNKLLENDWMSLGIGGLGRQFQEIFRRAFSTRLTQSTDVVSKIGVRHIKGMILHGPPGTGKTLIAKTIAKILKAKNVKIVSGPEIMSKFVGESERNLRALFDDAMNEDEENSGGLHVLIFDEIDAILRPRDSSDDSAARAVYYGVTTQMLAYMDGFSAQNNLLIIGLTNRLDALDKALLRPGRFEVQVRIPLPDLDGRSQIFAVHTESLSSSGYLGQDVSFQSLAMQSASFSGADIAGASRSAVTFALERYNRVKQLDSSSVFAVQQEDLERGVKEILSTKSTASNVGQFLTGGVLGYNAGPRKFLARVQRLVEDMRRSESAVTGRVLLRGLPGTGMTTLSALAARNGAFSFAHMITPESLIGLRLAEKITRISDVFDTALHVPDACIVLDDIERIFDYHGSSRMNTQLIDAVGELINRDIARLPQTQSGSTNIVPKLLIIVTSTNSEVLRYLNIGAETFDDRRTFLKDVQSPSELGTVMKFYDVFSSDDELRVALSRTPNVISIKALVKLINRAKLREGINTNAYKGKSDYLDLAESTDSSRKNPMDTSAEQTETGTKTQEKSKGVSLEVYFQTLRDAGLLDKKIIPTADQAGIGGRHLF